MAGATDPDRPGGRSALSLEDLRGIERPEESLWKYYVLKSFLLGPLFPILLVLLSFRFRTLRYRFDEEGLSMAWGMLFRREVHLAYDRIQDIHLVSNAVERWLGLARIQVQTASGSAKAEVTLEGIRRFEDVRDFLYSRMRGQSAAAPAEADGGAESPVAELRRAADELRELRRLLSESEGDGSEE